MKNYHTVGVIAAMPEEIDAVKQKLTDVTTMQISGITFYQGKYEGVSVVAAKCGVGKVFAAICAQTMIVKFAPDLILHIGVAGALSDSLHIGDIAIASSVVQHDMDTSALGDPVGMISGISLVHIPCTQSVVGALQSCAEKLKIHCEVGTIASGDCFMSDRERKKNIADTFGAIACEMEGASTGQVCFVNGVDFCVIRAISDSGDENASTDFAASLARASQAAIRLLDAFLTA